MPKVGTKYCRNRLLETPSQYYQRAKNSEPQSPKVKVIKPLQEEDNEASVSWTVNASEFLNEMSVNTTYESSIMNQVGTKYCRNRLLETPSQYYQRAKNSEPQSPKVKVVKPLQEEDNEASVSWTVNASGFLNEMSVNTTYESSIMNQPKQKPISSRRIAPFKWNKNVDSLCFSEEETINEKEQSSSRSKLAWRMIDNSRVMNNQDANEKGDAEENNVTRNFNTSKAKSRSAKINISRSKQIRSETKIVTLPKETSSYDSSLEEELVVSACAKRNSSIRNKSAEGSKNLKNSMCHVSTIGIQEESVLSVQPNALFTMQNETRNTSCSSKLGHDRENVNIAKERISETTDEDNLEIESSPTTSFNKSSKISKNKLQQKESLGQNDARKSFSSTPNDGNEEFSRAVFSLHQLSDEVSSSISDAVLRNVGVELSPKSVNEANRSYSCASGSQIVHSDKSSSCDRLPPSFNNGGELPDVLDDINQDDTLIADDANLTEQPSSDEFNRRGASSPKKRVSFSSCVLPETDNLDKKIRQNNRQTKSKGKGISRRSADKKVSVHQAQGSFNRYKRPLQPKRNETQETFLSSEEETSCAVATEDTVTTDNTEWDVSTPKRRSVSFSTTCTSAEVSTLPKRTHRKVNMIGKGEKNAKVSRQRAHKKTSSPKRPKERKRFRKLVDETVDEDGTAESSIPETTEEALDTDASGWGSTDSTIQKTTPKEFKMSDSTFLRHVEKDIASRNTNELIVPSPNVNGLRRSKRTRVPTLEFWRNQRIRYKLVGKCYEIEGINNCNRREVKKRSKPSSAAKSIVSLEKFANSDGSDFAVINPNNNREIYMTCFAQESEVQYVGLSGKPATETDNVVMCKNVEQEMFSLGILKLKGKATKPQQYLKNATMCFFVHKGTIVACIHKQAVKLTVGDSFFVPSGNTYGIKNCTNTEAVLYFHELSHQNGEK